MITLYISTHNKTGLKYFGKSTKYHTQEDLQKYYYGSGKYWKRHLNKHGDDVTMEIYYQSDSEIEISSVALFYTKFYNIVDSKLYANLREEDGLWGGALSQESRNKMSKSQKKRWDNISDSENQKRTEKISISNKKTWKNKTQSEINDIKHRVSKNNSGTIQSEEHIKKRFSFRDDPERVKIISEKISKSNKGKKRTDETKSLMSTKMKEKRWYNNGTSNKRFIPGTEDEGWDLGMLSRV